VQYTFTVVSLGCLVFTNFIPYILRCSNSEIGFGSKRATMPMMTILLI
jgi:hypothetical protein